MTMDPKQRMIEARTRHDEAATRLADAMRRGSAYETSIALADCWEAFEEHTAAYNERIAAYQ